MDTVEIGEAIKKLSSLEFEGMYLPDSLLAVGRSRVL